MPRLTKACVIIIAASTLAACNGYRDLSDLPVRDTPQTIAPVSPTVAIIAKAAA